VNGISEKERLGLEEVFMVISSNKQNTMFTRIKDHLHTTIHFYRKKGILPVKKSGKIPKIGNFLAKNRKKKNFLSK